MPFGTRTQLAGWKYAIKKGYLSFAFDQGFALDRLPNQFVKAGVCNAMCYDWIKRGLCGARVSSRTYQNIPQNVVSMQMGVQSGVKTFVEYAARDDLHVGLMAKVRNVEKGALFVGMDIWKRLSQNKKRLNRGFAHVGFGGESGGHAVAFRLAGYRSRFFDPNFGECKFASEDEMRKFWNKYSENMYWSKSEMHTLGYEIRTLVGIPKDALALLKSETMTWL